MSFTDAQAIMWVNGELVPAGQATIPALDHGLTVGDGVFEAVKVVRGQAFMLQQHIERLERSANGLGLEFPGQKELNLAASAILAANHGLLQDTNAVLRVTLTAGVGQVGSGRLDKATPRLLLAVTHLPDMPATTSCITVPWQRNSHGALTGLKTTSYAENALALAKAKAAGASEALWANSEGNLCEGTGSNVFVVLDGELITPPLTDGPLSGITRALVIQWSGVTERSVPFEALFQASEVFLTSTGRNVQGVTKIDGQPIGNGQLGPVTAEAAEVFALGEARLLQAPDTVS